MCYLYYYYLKITQVTIKLKLFRVQCYMVTGGTVVVRNVLEGLPKKPTTGLRTKERMGVKKAEVG